MTHVFQLLDVVIFHPIKSHFSRLIQHIKLATPGWKKTVNCCKTNFTKLFKEPWESMSTALIKTGFRKCGIHPLNRNAIDKNRFTQDKVYSAATPASTSNTTLSDGISTLTFISKDQPDERSYEETITPAGNEPSNNISKLNQIESTSSPVNPLVAAGIIPLHILESFIIPAVKEQMQTIPRVVIKGRWFTSDEDIRLYKEKVEKIRNDIEAKERRKAERQQKKIKKILNVKEEVLEQEVD